MPRKKRMLRCAAVLAVAPIVTAGCVAGAAGPEVRAADGAAGAAPVYRLAVVRSHAVVLVLESTGAVDVVGPGVELAVRRAEADEEHPALSASDVARIGSGRLRPDRTAELSAPLGGCVSVTPWSGAEVFAAAAYADPGDPDGRLRQVVLRYADAASAAAGAVRVRHQFEACDDGPEVRVDARTRAPAGGVDEVFVGARVGPGA